MSPNNIESEPNIQELENLLPIPYYFKELIKTYRKFGKQARKEGNNKLALQYFNQMLSLSKIWHQVYGSRKSSIEGWEVDKAEEFLKKFLLQHQTLYVFTFQKDGPVRGDVLLSTTDYRILQQLSESVV